MYCRVKMDRIVRSVACLTAAIAVTIITFDSVSEGALSPETPNPLLRQLRGTSGHHRTGAVSNLVEVRMGRKLSRPLDTGHRPNPFDARIFNREATMMRPSSVDRLSARRRKNPGNIFQLFRKKRSGKKFPKPFQRGSRKLKNRGPYYYGGRGFTSSSFGPRPLLEDDFGGPGLKLVSHHRHRPKKLKNGQKFPSKYKYHFKPGIPDFNKIKFESPYGKPFPDTFRDVYGNLHLDPGNSSEDSVESKPPYGGKKVPHESSHSKAKKESGVKMESDSGSKELSKTKGSDSESMSMEERMKGSSDSAEDEKIRASKPGGKKSKYDKGRQSSDEKSEQKYLVIKLTKKPKKKKHHESYREPQFHHESSSFEESAEGNGDSAGNKHVDSSDSGEEKSNKRRPHGTSRVVTKNKSSKVKPKLYYLLPWPYARQNEEQQCGEQSCDSDVSQDTQHFQDNSAKIHLSNFGLSAKEQHRLTRGNGGYGSDERGSHGFQPFPTGYQLSTFAQNQQADQGSQTLVSHPIGNFGNHWQPIAPSQGQGVHQTQSDIFPSHQQSQTQHSDSRENQTGPLPPLDPSPWVPYVAPTTGYGASGMEEHQPSTVAQANSGEGGVPQTDFHGHGPRTQIDQRQPEESSEEDGVRHERTEARQQESQDFRSPDRPKTHKQTSLLPAYAEYDSSRSAEGSRVGDRTKQDADEVDARYVQRLATDYLPVVADRQRDSRRRRNKNKAQTAGPATADGHPSSGSASDEFDPDSPGPMIESQVSEEIRRGIGDDGRDDDGQAEKHYYRRTRRRYRLIPSSAAAKKKVVEPKTGSGDEESDRGQGPRKDESRETERS